MKNLSTLQLSILICFLVLSQVVYGQFTKQWEFTLEGDARHPKSYSINRSVPLRAFPTSNGEFIVVSITENGFDHLPQTIYVYRFDSDGNVKWEYKYPSAYGINEDIYDATMDPFDHILIAGKTSTLYLGEFEPIESANALLLKITPDGTLAWKRESALPSSHFTQRCTSVDTDIQGNIYSSSSLLTADSSLTMIEKWNPAGDLLWSTVLDNSYFTRLSVVDSLLVVIMRPDAWHMQHLTLDGELIYSNEISQVTAALKPTFDAEGNWYNPNFTGKFRIEKRNTAGDTLWAYHKLTNQPHNVHSDEIEDYTIDSDGNIYLTGRYYGPHYGDTSLHSNCDILTVKLNKDGQVIWENLYQYTDLRSCQTGNRIQVREDGHILVAGSQSVRQGSDPYHSYDMIILAYDANGHRIDSVYYNGIANMEDNGVNLLLADDAVYLLGWSQQQDSLYDQVVIKYENELTPVAPADDLSEAFIIYPNPTADRLFIKGNISPDMRVKVFNTTGYMLYEQVGLDAIEVSHFASGLYVLEISSDAQSDNHRFRFVKM